MTTIAESKIEFLNVVDFAIDQVGERIEAVYPLLADIDPKTDEYKLLNQMWLEWCDYLAR